MLVSLTTPKQAARTFKGPFHYLGAVCPPAIKEKYRLVLPQYPGASQAVRLPENPERTSAGTTDESGNGVGSIDVASIRTQYRGGESGRGLTEEDAGTDPLRLFETWLADAVSFPSIMVCVLSEPLLKSNVGLK
eukprot:jgi/Botrbrau1/15275/Bobra.97_1s0001.1